MHNKCAQFGKKMAEKIGNKEENKVDLHGRVV